MRELWDLSRCVLIWFYKFLTGKSGYKLISWHVSLLSDRSHISAERTFCRKEARNAVLTGFKGPKVMKLTWQIIDFVNFSSSQKKKNSQIAVARRGFPWLQQRLVFSSLPAALDQHRNTHRSKELCCDFCTVAKQHYYNFLISRDERWHKKSFSSKRQ